MAPASTRLRIAGARKAVIQSRPAGLRVSQARLGDHAAIADQHHAFKLEALFELGDLARQRRRIADIAFEHFDRDWAALGRAQKPEHDLQLAGFAVAIVAKLGERTGAPLEIG